MPMCEDIPPNINKNLKCSVNYDNKVIFFKNGKCYHDDIYFGEITYIDENTIKVLCKNGNRYMDNQIIEYKYYFV